MTKKRLIRGVNVHNVVSFDIFDTLVERDTLLPTQIFRRVGERCLPSELAENFVKQRVQAERQARTRQESREVLLDEIYAELSDVFPREVSENLKQAEIEEELKTCSARQDMSAVYEHAVKSGKKVLLISDMYLPQEVICDILNKCNIYNYTNVYVSGVCRANKRSGKLFELVATAQSIERKEWLHIGDSVKADFLAACKQNIDAYLILRKKWIKRKIYGWLQKF